MQHMALWGSVAAILALGVGCSHPNDRIITEAIGHYEATLASPSLAAGDPPRAGKGRSDAVEDQPHWLEMGRYLARKVSTQSGQSGTSSSPSPRPQQQGPAYPGNILQNIEQDARKLPAAIWDDTKATVTNPLSLVGIALAGASGIALSSSGSDDHIADHFERHGSQLNSFWDSVGDVGGNPGTHFAVAGAMYLASLARQDTKTYEVSKTLVNALAINGVATLALKGIVRTRSPNGDPYGWPSGHTSSTFCLATVMYEQYGPVIGLPLYAFAAFVGYERIDARNHDFSDVISGALLGMAIGHAVSQNHQSRILGMQVVPMVDPASNTVGVALVKRY